MSVNPERKAAEIRAAIGRIGLTPLPKGCEWAIRIQLGGTVEEARAVQAAIDGAFKTYVGSRFTDGAAFAIDTVTVRLGNARVEVDYHRPATAEELAARDGGSRENP